MKVSVKNPAKKYWQEVISNRDSVYVERIDVFRNHLVLSERENGVRKFRIINLTSSEDHYVGFPEPVYYVFISENPEFNSNQFLYNTNLLRFGYTSLTTPWSVYDYNMDTKELELKKQDEVFSGYNPKDYQSERIFVEALDKTKIPISMVYKRNMINDKSNPMLLYGYGYDGVSEDAYFDSNIFSLLNRGFIYAVAHVRGGGEMGRYWHEDGKLLKKKNSFSDFIACAEHLINEKYTSSEKLIIKGLSGGGLLMGAVVNMRPDLFKAVIAEVPWVDIITSNFEPSYDHAELGNPIIEEDYFYMKSYSPYDNVKEMNYPNMLITAGLYDASVSYWSPAKWTARLRALKTDENLLLLKTNMVAGHGGSSGRYDYIKDVAFEYAFILDVLGIKE
jgi:oligopeptidase B